MHGIRKAFYGNRVLEGVDLIVKKGEVHALLGENGAGKSTLMNILAGVIRKDEGSVFFDGKELEGGSVAESENAGIAFVHQELNTVNDLKVYENLFLNREITGKFGVLNKAKMISEAHSLFSRFGIDMDPLEKAGNLSTSQKQMLEIGNALLSEAKLIILDEPTTALSNNEIEHFFEMIGRLKKEEKAFIFISHKMPEIFRIADTYSVLRNGMLISDGSISEVTPEKVTGDMVGKSFDNRQTYEKRELGETVLEMEHLSGIGFEDVSLSVRKGEIIGFTGLQGSGCSNLMEAVFGIQRITSGSLKIRGSEVGNHSINHAMKSGLAMVPSNRKENSVIASMSILENMYVSEHTLSAGQPLINRKKENEKFEGFRNSLNIKTASSRGLLVSLSGGNQQKVIIARWLDTEADILLLDNPTQGIDVGAKGEIYELIIKLAKEGKTILINTLEIPEIQKIADRCIVFYHGKMARILEREEIREDTVMMYATNAAFDAEWEVENG